MLDNFVLSEALIHGDDPLRIVSTTGKSFWFAIAQNRRENSYFAWLVPIGADAYSTAKKIDRERDSDLIPATGADFDGLDFSELFSSKKAECFRDEKVKNDCTDTFISDAEYAFLPGGILRLVKLEDHCYTIGVWKADSGNYDGYLFPNGTGPEAAIERLSGNPASLIRAREPDFKQAELRRIYEEFEFENEQ